MACTNPQNPSCPNCNKSGLAILPVRYAVVPSEVKATLPATLGNKVSNVKLAHHKYALRTLREGYVYLFHEKNPRGSHIKWEVYSVSPDGTLWKQLSINAIKPVSADQVCSRSGHNIPASIIAIEKPEKCGKVWIAFSEHAWSEDTFKLFESDAKLRDKRMQTFLPATWIKAKDYRHGLEGTQANVEQVIEYHNGFSAASLTGGTVTDISDADGKHKPDNLKKQTTRYPLHMRKDQSKQVAEVMKKVGEQADGNNNPPIVLALWDAVGITHELNGFRNDAAGWIEKYGQERELEITAMNAIEGVKKALEGKAADNETQRQQDTVKHAPQIGPTQERRANAAKLSEPQRSQQIEVCNILDNWEQRQLPATLGYSMRLNVANTLPEPKRSAEIAIIKADAEEFLARRAKNSPEQIAKAKARAWPKYADKLNEPVYEKFKKEYDTFLTAADRLIDARTDDLIMWLESPSLIHAFTEFHVKNVDDGVVFDDQVGTAMHGINSSVKGKAKIDAWVKEMKASESNLLWRAIALNQEEGMADLNNALQEAEQHKNQRTLASALSWVNYANKSLKVFADTHKKATGVYNANTAASSNAGSKAFGARIKPLKLHGTDKIAMTAGDAVFRHFRVNALADHASEKIIQHIFSIRAFVDPGDSIRLIMVQAQNETDARGQLLRRMQAAKTFLATDLPPIKTAQSENLSKAWTEFRAKNSGAANAIKDARLALIVMLIEGANFSKLIGDCALKGDAKSWWSLGASGVSITSALFDIASVPAKSVFGAESWSYQKLKMFGGVLSTAATAVAVVFDWKDMIKANDKGQSILRKAYLLKAGLGAASIGLTAAATFTYSAPMIGRLTGNAALGTAARAVGARAASIIGARILFMSAGTWITVGTFGIQVFIWVITDDGLQNWCSLCIFGKKRTAPAAYKTTVKQNEELQKALIEVGVGA